MASASSDPESLTVDLQCPLCSAAVLLADERYVCQGCRHEFPQLLGIPDFRVSANTWINFADDWELARSLAALYDTSTFEDLVRYVWGRRSHVPEDIVEKRLKGIDRSQRKYLSELEPDGWIGRRTKTLAGDRCLEIGCGTGGFLTAASRSFRSVVGIDVSLAWLITAKKRLEQQGTNATLLCACVESLPFPDEQFDLIAAFDVLEHVDDPGIMIAEMRRTTRIAALSLCTTPNRYSLSAEPHVGIWGVGFLPRRYMADYVKWRNGMQYHHTRLLSLFDLQRLFQAGHRCAIVAPSIWNEEIQDFRPFKQLAALLYNRVVSSRLGRSMLLPVAPFFQVWATKLP
jgi:SAM-dependent methyltransferase